jgi:hypothetical protein
VNQRHDHQPEQHRDQKTDRQIHDRLDHRRNSPRPAAKASENLQELPCRKPFVNHIAMGGGVNASPMPR